MTAPVHQAIDYLMGALFLALLNGDLRLLCEDTEPRHIQSQGLNSGVTNSPGSFHTV